MEEAERQLPAFPVRNYTEAKAVVKHALLAIDSAKGFFTLHERASDYFDCVFDHSAIFGAVVPFEPELENRCKMIKRRIDMLEALAGELNPTYFLQHCRKIHYELGDIYSQQVSLKYAVHEATFARQQAQLAGGSGGESLDPAIVEKNVQAMRKINLLTVKSIGHYHRFLGTFEVLNPGGAKEAIKNLKVALPFEKIDMYPLPKRIEESAGETETYLQAIVTSYLAVGRLYIKIVTSTPSDRVRYWMTCEKYYKALKTYLVENDDQRREHFEEYEKQLDEMLALIPGKIQQILSQSVC